MDGGCLKRLFARVKQAPGTKSQAHTCRWSEGGGHPRQLGEEAGQQNFYVRQNLTHKIQ